MTVFKRLKILFVVAAVALFGIVAAEEFSIPLMKEIVPAAEARIGRPLTPYSVAGVARRTVRRCAVGVYYC
jgi:hypothetical protein